MKPGTCRTSVPQEGLTGEQRKKYNGIEARMGSWKSEGLHNPTAERIPSYTFASGKYEGVFFMSP